MGFKTKNDNKKDGRKQKGQKKAEHTAIQNTLIKYLRCGIKLK